MDVAEHDGAYYVDETIARIHAIVRVPLEQTPRSSSSTPRERGAPTLRASEAGDGGRSAAAALVRKDSGEADAGKPPPLFSISVYPGMGRPFSGLRAWLVKRSAIDSSAERNMFRALAGSLRF